MEKYLVTSALPYANGKLHIGHVAGAYLPADIYVRYLRLKDNDVVYICGTDEHGAPISILAEKEGVSPREIADYYHKSISASFKGLAIDFDNFSGTARQIHHDTATEFFLNLHKNGYINIHTREQFYCEHDKRFLADRYVEGVCPFCHKDGARGDQCDSCGKLVDTLNLVEPKCKICGNKPIIRETEHWFLNLPAFQDRLKDWLETKTYWKENILRFILGMLEEGLKERAVTRDIDWGVPVPLPNAEGKVLYVWFDAPIGYLSSTKEWAEKVKGDPELWKKYWLDPKTKLIHFIGKDNNVFHAIFWPSVLMGQDESYVLPHDIPANEFLNLEGRKLSTSNNWAIWADDFLEDFHGDLLRYYLAAIAPETRDSDFSWKEFQDKNNSELANTFGNLANRVFVFSEKYYKGKIRKPDQLSERGVKCLAEAKDMIAEIDESFANYRVRKSVKLSMDIARLGNRFFDETKPWETVKSEADRAEETLYVCLQLLSYLSVTLYPVIPRKITQLRIRMNLEQNPKWFEMETDHREFTISGGEPLFPRIDDQIIAVQLEKLFKKAALEEAEEELEHKDTIEFDDFMKLEMRIVEIHKAEEVPKSKKLVKLTIKCGNEERTVMAGIAQSYKPQELVGKKVLMLLNLKPRKIFGTESQGMLLAAESEGELSLLVPDKDPKSGSPVS